MRAAFLLLSGLCGGLMGGCASLPSPSTAIYIAAPDGATVKARPAGQLTWAAVGIAKEGGVVLIPPATSSLEIESFTPGALPSRVVISQPYPRRLEMRPEPGPEYLTELLRENIRFVQRGPDLLVLEPANRPVKLFSAYRVYVPRRQAEVSMFVSAITPDYVLLQTEEGDRLAFPILTPKPQ